MPDGLTSSSRKPRGKPGRASSNWKTLQTVLPKVPAAVKERNAQKKKLRNEAALSSHNTQSISSINPITPSLSSSPTSQKLLDILQKNSRQPASSKQTEVGKYLAIDCEMVGVGPREAEESALARVSIVNYYGNVVLDTYVQPKEKVKDYRTWVSGIKPEHLENASSFEDVTRQVADLTRNKILIGHAISNDLQALLLSHPRQMIRDTSTYQPLRKLAKTKFPSLKKLALLVLDVEIQKDSHCSVDDARATLAIYRTQKDEWEALVRKEQARQQAHPPV
ncbi:hypothetical protein PCASD_18441 [Puccinia coronata f. sp. avenae]|uniref:RNA exonuclease 4 n=1 Tax=Puccinia coronata f. sp. avenae TaxID=200324 RepID=A0A2N5TZ49_9BASI|nr:hypothetical protein PCASD_18441 [Puccinia coronata f. sp. avenae]